MIRYTVYLPSHTHDPLPIGAIDYRPAANQAVLLGLLGKDDVLLADKLCHASMQEAALQLDGKNAETFYSVAAAMHRVQARYPSAFLEDGE